MMASIRTVWAVAALVLLLGVGCARERKSVMVDPALLPLVPASTTMLAGLRVEALQKTPVWRRYMDSPEWKTRLDDFTERTGFDPRQDLMEVVWAWDGKEALVFVRNRFSQGSVEPKLRKEGVVRMSYKGYPMLGTPEYAALFMNPSTAIAGRTERLKQVVDARDGSKGQAPADLLERLKSIPPDTHFWVAGSAAALQSMPMGDTNLGDNLPRLLRGVDGFFAAVDARDNIQLQVRAFCDSEVAAKQTETALKGLLAVARLSLPGPQRALLLPLLEAAEVRRVENTATAQATATLEQIEAIQTKLPMGRNAE